MLISPHFSSLILRLSPFLPCHEHEIVLLNVQLDRSNINSLREHSRNNDDQSNFLEKIPSFLVSYRLLSYCDCGVTCIEVVLWVKFNLFYDHLLFKLSLRSQCFQYEGVLWESFFLRFLTFYFIVHIKYTKVNFRLTFKFHPNALT